MKLSLTAIAALSAAFFHPTVATGTRAASSTGNTNAAEDKPNRDLFLINEVDQFVDGVFESKFEALETNGLLKVLNARILSEMAVGWFGTDGKLSVGIVGDLLGQNEGEMIDFEIFKLDDDGDDGIDVLELARGLTQVKDEDLLVFKEVMDLAMTGYGYGYGHGKRN